MEFWFYAPPGNPNQPELIEMVRMVTEADGTTWGMERRVTSSARTTVDASDFAVPAGIEIRDRRRVQ